MPTIHTPFGPVDALPEMEYFADGSVRSCRAARACPLATPFGTFIPQFTANTLRKRQLPAILFYPNGMIRTLPLEEQQSASTPLGVLPAEQVTLYESGALKRVFPLNGALSGYWTQEDESGLAELLALDTPAGPLEAMYLSVYFGPQGNVRSLTLWPGQIVDAPCPLGSLPVRTGISFYDNGAIRSVEPSTPWPMSTPVGQIVAWDPEVLGVCGDANSLRFRENGELSGLKTVAHSFTVTLENGRVRRVSPPLHRHPCDDARLVAGPLDVEFGQGTIRLSSADTGRVTAPWASVLVSTFSPPLALFPVSCTTGGGKW